MKATSVLVQLDAPLRYLPPDVRGALEQFLFGWCQGTDERHTARWRRLWRRLYRSNQPRPSMQLWVEVDRDLPFHARWMAIEARIWDTQEAFATLAGLRWWLKTGAGFGRYEPAPAGGLTFVPSSLNWEDCSDDEMREFTDDALAFLRTPHALATLWPLVAEDRRIDMLEATLINPRENP